MKIVHDVNETTLGNTGSLNEFKIRSTARSFQILSSGLYGNKVQSIIRELSTNAFDSHVAANKKDVPFEVHLPSMLEPWFSVKDFGIGLSKSEIVNVYTTYFESTKSESNDYVGALGLGSKSPFSYTENFTVISVKNKRKNIYSAFINEHGVPSIAEMSSEATSDQNGVEVKFSVVNKYDYGRFAEEARQVYRWFTIKPVITGQSNFIHREIDYKEKDIVPGVHLRTERASPIALMGNIAYPLDDIPDTNKYLGSLASILDSPLVIEFDIGELDFTASREKLSYIPLTLTSIRNKLQKVADNIYGVLKDRLDSITCEWKKSQTLYEYYENSLYRASVIQYVTDTKFKLFEAGRYNRSFSLFVNSARLNNKKLTIRSFRASNGSTHKLSEISRYINNISTRGYEIPVNSFVIFVLNDLKTGCFERAKSHFIKQSGMTTVICIDGEFQSEIERDKEYQLLLSELHNPPNVLKASSFPKVERKRPLAPANGIMEMISHSRYEYTWKPYTEPIDDKQTYYYVALNNVTALDKTGNIVNVFHTNDLLTNSSILGLQKIKILGVRKTHIKDIEKLPNWVWYEDAIKAEIGKITLEDITKLVCKSELDNYTDSLYNNKDVAKLVAKTSPYYSFAIKYPKDGYYSGNIHNVSLLLKMYGSSFDIDKIRNDVIKEKAFLEKRYPLLKHLECANKNDIAQYINLIDLQEKT